MMRDDNETRGHTAAVATLPQADTGGADVAVEVEDRETRSEKADDESLEVSVIKVDEPASLAARDSSMSSNVDLSKSPRASDTTVQQESRELKLLARHLDEKERDEKIRERANSQSSRQAASPSATESSDISPASRSANTTSPTNSSAGTSPAEASRKRLSLLHQKLSQVTVQSYKPSGQQPGAFQYTRPQQPQQPAQASASFSPPSSSLQTTQASISPVSSSSLPTAQASVSLPSAPSSPVIQNHPIDPEYLVEASLVIPADEHHLQQRPSISRDGSGEEKDDVEAPSQEQTGEDIKTGEGEQTVPMQDFLRLRDMQYFIVCLVCLFGVILCVVVVIVFMMQVNKSSDDNGNGDGDDDGLAGAATLDPATKLLLPIFPNYTLPLLHDPSSPQSQAASWLVRHPEIEDMEEWRKLQLFALMTFYYSFHGDDWPPGDRSFYGSYTKNECEWGELGLNGNLCHDDDNRYDGHFKQLLLNGIDGLQGGMPPEIALLTTLLGLSLSYDEFRTETELSDLIPAEMVGNLRFLKWLKFEANSNLMGTIPSELGAFTELRLVKLNGLTSSVTNDVGLSGTIPADIGLSLTKLTHLDLANNSLTGTSSLTDLIVDLQSTLAVLRLEQNNFSGKIPTELGLLSDSLYFLSLDSNRFAGELPTELFRLTNLVYLSLTNNSDLVGEIPFEFCSIKTLSSLRIDCSRVTCPEACDCTCGPE